MPHPSHLCWAQRKSVHMCCYRYAVHNITLIAFHSRHICLPCMLPLLFWFALRWWVFSIHHCESWLKAWLETNGNTANRVHTSSFVRVAVVYEASDQDLGLMHAVVQITYDYAVVGASCMGQRLKGLKEPQAAGSQPENKSSLTI